MRIEGRVEKMSAPRVRRVLRQTRPLDSRIGAWASPQSQVISSRVVLVAEAARVRPRFLRRTRRARRTGAATACPRTAFEFWQGRQSRLHDRLRYTLQPDGTWLRERLAP